jgi:hypothetical protein
MDSRGPRNLNHLKPLPPQNGFVWETSPKAEIPPPHSSPNPSPAT